MYNDIYLFVEAVKYRSFAKTAEALNLQQSTVSRRIQNLEDILKFELFIKKHDGIELTTKGEKFYYAVSQPIRNLKDIQIYIQKERNREVGELRLSLAPGFSASCIDPFLHEFHALYPNIYIKINYSNFDYNIDNTNDLVIISRYPKNNNVKFRKIYSTSLVLACSKNYSDNYGLPKNLTNIVDHKTAGIRKDSYFPQIINTVTNETISNFIFQPDIIFQSLAQTSYLIYYNNYIAMCLYDHIKAFNLIRVLPEYQFGTIDYYLIKCQPNKKIVDIFITFIDKIMQRNTSGII